MKVLPFIRKNLQIYRTKLFKVKDLLVILRPTTVFNKTFQYFKIKTYSLKIKEF